MFREGNVSFVLFFWKELHLGFQRWFHPPKNLAQVVKVFVDSVQVDTILWHFVSGSS